MAFLFVPALAGAGLLVLLGGWLGWQLLRQNGRILLRLEELEARLDKIEFGPGDEPESREATASGLPGHSGNAEGGSGAATRPAGVGRSDADDGNDRAGRFSSRSLARSKIKRDGLKPGSAAPDFLLPRLDGRGDLTFSELRGRRVLLVFSSPGCGPCNELAPRLEQFHREQTQGAVGRATSSESGGVTSQHGAQGTAHPTREAAVEVVMISKGEPDENRAKIKEHGLSFPVVLQQHWEISRRFALFATPAAYLVDEQGVIAREAAVGLEPIRELLKDSSWKVTWPPASNVTVA